MKISTILFISAFALLTRGLDKSEITTAQLLLSGGILLVIAILLTTNLKVIHYLKSMSLRLIHFLKTVRIVRVSQEPVGVRKTTEIKVIIKTK